MEEFPTDTRHILPFLAILEKSDIEKPMEERVNLWPTNSVLSINSPASGTGAKSSVKIWASAPSVSSVPR
jgi:hypothetical protein